MKEGRNGVFRVIQLIREDVRAVFERDPAARDVFEILLAYPGLHAIWLHRLAHRLYKADMPVVPRLISHLNRFLTGIEIHPGAKIGRRFFIDHGMGVVIGETAEVGNDVTLYQGVTLGTSHTHDVRALRGVKRHPTLEDGVTVFVGAEILGAITVGEGAIVGAGSVVTKDVPAHTTVVGVPGRVVVERDPSTGEQRRVDDRRVSLPDPELEVIRCLHHKVLELEERLAALESGREPALAHAAHHATSPSSSTNGTNGAKAPCGDEIDRVLRAYLEGREERRSRD
ncbi:MAG: serine O-acetyltransferase [Chloroflexi bacterium]|nr:serine O-acetyltransferase [Chloroflexota bacterium]